MASGKNAGIDGTFPVFVLNKYGGRPVLSMHFVGYVESDHFSARSISAHFSQKAREMGHPELLWEQENQKWATPAPMSQVLQPNNAK
jgi:hypothetical protein